MAKKNYKTNEKNNKLKQQNGIVTQESEYSEKVERTYKRILKTLSWVVGIAFVMIIILPQFNSPSLDKVTKILFLIGITNLLIFIIIEFVGNGLKTLLSLIINE